MTIYNYVGTHHILGREIQITVAAEGRIMSKAIPDDEIEKRVDYIITLGHVRGIEDREALLAMFRLAFLEGAIYQTERTHGLLREELSE